MSASSDGNVEVVKILLENGAGINAKDDEGTTPLMHAAAKGNKEMIELLKEAGAVDE